MLDISPYLEYKYIGNSTQLTEMKYSLTILILSVQFCLTFAAERCTKNSHCSCNTDKLGEVSLVGIAGEAGYLETNFGEKYKFRFFPCGIEKDWGERCNKQDDPAFCQYIYTQSTTINLGRLESMQVQSFNEFVTVFNYTGGSSLGSTNRSSEIALICNPNITTTVFKFIEEVNLGHYKFELTSNRVCPGLIDEGCQRIDSCTCKLDNEKGIVTMHKLLENMNRVGFEIKDKGTLYYLLPCPIKANSSVYEYCDVGITGDPAGCMKTPDTEKFTLGKSNQSKHS